MQIFQHYEIKKRPDGSLWELGRGAMGVSYLAVDTLLDREVALKVISASMLASETARARFQREARAAARIHHENVALVYQFGQEGDQFFYAMEFVRGETLEEFLRDKGPLDPADAVEVAIQVCRALGAAQREGLIHRDIKPANLMLTRTDEGMRVKVIDFGLAKSSEGSSPMDATLTVAGFVGTPYFASLEQLQEQPLDIRSDLYSLGVTLWFLLSGNPPFGGTFANLVVQHLHANLPMEKIANLPESLRSVLERALQKLPQDRFQTPQEFREALENCLPSLSGVKAATGAKVTAAGASVASTEMETMVDVSPKPEEIAKVGATRAAPPPSPSPSAPTVRASGGKSRILPSAIAGVLLVMAVVALVIFFGNRTQKNNLGASSTTVAADAGTDGAKVPEEGTPTVPVLPALPVEAAAQSSAQPEQPEQVTEGGTVVPAAASAEAEPDPPSAAGSAELSEVSEVAQEQAEPTPDPQLLLLAGLDEAKLEEVAGRFPEAIRRYLDLLARHPEDRRAETRLNLLFAELETRRVASGKDTPIPSNFVPLAEEAANAGVVSAMVYLANSILKADPVKAVRLYTGAAKQGDPHAMNQLGLQFSTGEGVGVPDPDRSVELFQKSSELGNAAGKLYLADALMQESGLFEKFYAPEKAVELLLESAALGEPRAMRKLGFFYDKGIVVQQSDLTAFQWYERAWQQGYARAAADLGIFYMNGRGVPRKDERRAAELFSEGAMKGDPLAMTFYAICLQEGIGVKQDKVRAREFFVKAAEAGEPRAIEECRKLEIPHSRPRE